MPNRPRLATPNPLQPAQYNREQTEARMLSRHAGSSTVRCLNEQAHATLDERIAEIKAQARSRITKIATEATTKIARINAQKGDSK